MAEGSGTLRIDSDADLLAALMLKAEVGEVVTFAAMSAALGRRVDGGSAVVQRAIRICFEQRHTFWNERGIGYRRLADEEIARTGPTHLKRVRRKIGRGMEFLGAVGDFAALSREAQIEHNTHMAVLAIAADTLRPAAVASIRQRAAAIPEVDYSAVVAAAREATR